MLVGHDTVCWLLLQCFPSGRLYSGGPSLSELRATHVIMDWCVDTHTVYMQYSGLQGVHIVPPLADAATAFFCHS